MPPRLKRPRSSTPVGPAVPPQDGLSPHKDKKLKRLAAHALASPFPAHPHPTPAAAAAVHAVLAAAHPGIATAHARAPPAPTNDAARTCGRVPDVLAALVGTILSQNTTAANAAAAQRGLARAFGRDAFAAVARAPPPAVVAAIRPGGLANRKARVIQRLLCAVRARHGAYSLQHLVHARADGEAMRELVSYDGVGPKTAACVLLFCLGRAAFPVDTHVFRLARLLGWVPAAADRVTAQAHLDLAIPDELKYGLHVLMVGHGRSCAGCKGGRREKGGCVLKEWLRDQKGVDEDELEQMSVKAEDVKAEEEP